MGARKALALVRSRGWWWWKQGQVARFSSVEVADGASCEHGQAHAHGAQTEESSSLANITPYFSKVSQIMTGKSLEVMTVAPNATVFEAIELMGRSRVGSLCVVETSEDRVKGPADNGEDASKARMQESGLRRKDKLVGIVTERDYLCKVSLLNRSAKSTLVSQIMTPADKLVTVTPNTSAGECIRLMRDHSIRHLPVLENGELLCVLSIRELLGAIAKDHEEQVRYLQNQLIKLATLLQT
ncbi:CBS domain-containing protein CBSX3, mitochondrial [Porphyridium purpureum]|uniref:CBS domain-containing protein CBSX3, mitochondrial n=1 Tax=Porphyridium purpureum TaxID=35688 RepID=A0A5J4Z995_PORPP|nr:CBS domain-containing protein CBSX3, mitochondrial [Porphyridium purpureum]|eukprot:POR3131..scf295_1